MRHPHFLLVALFSAALGCASAQSQSSAFLGTPILRDEDPEGRTFILVEPFGYLDPKGVKWEARPGLVFDGASIPRALWTVVGSPYTGSYRRAAILHDYYCFVQSRPWGDVHHMFYDAMLTGGVGRARANLMFYAVWRFGPRWEIRADSTCTTDEQGRIVCPRRGMFTTRILTVEDSDASRQAMLAELERVKDQVENEQATLESVISLADSQPKLDRDSGELIIFDRSRYLPE